MANPMSGGPYPTHRTGKTMRKFVAGVLACVCMTVSPAVVEAHPVIVSMSIKNCSSNTAQTASVSLVMVQQPGSGTVRYAFRNIATGQLHNFDRPMNYTGPNEFTLPGGNYTMRISYILSAAGGVVPGSAQLLYETPISVPTFSRGVCVMPGVAR